MTTASAARKTHDDPQARFFNRDLSWLEFNRRVLAQAEDESLPLLERVRFLSIFTSNLDEFFMKRVGLIRRSAHAGIAVPGPDGLSPRQQMAAIRELVVELQTRQMQVFTQSIDPSLRREGIEIVRESELSSKERAWLNDWYRHHVFPALTPLAVDPTHRFPFISNLSDNVAILAEYPPDGDRPPAEALARPSGLESDHEHPLFARVKLPPAIKRYIALPVKAGRTGTRFVPLTDVIRANLAGLFPGMIILERAGFRVTRSAGIQKDELETANLLQSVEADLKQRRFARVVRLEVDADCSPAMLHWLRDRLNLDHQDVYERGTATDFAALGELCDLDRPDLKFKPWKAVTPPRLLRQGVERTTANFFATIRKQDVLLHHPYESFHASVERFIAAAASDPDVLTIKQTLYRTSPDSPFVESLIRAAESGKQVACLVELRARFDEHRNVRFARDLEKAGVHVAYGVMGLKTHCKVSLVVRREKSGLRCYAHLGTGNYHPKTAQLYTDVGLLTCDPEITADIVQLFNYLTGLAASQSYPTLLVAPFTMRQRFAQLIEREMELARKGKPARIIAKVNALEDRDMAERLYTASQAGVKVVVICRGFCCLRPGVPGLSENIRVLSIVGRFLEHSRIYHFSGGMDDPADGEWFIASADWMYRNLSNRVEAAVPVRDRVARARLARIVEVNLADHRSAWELTPEGTYVKRRAPAEALADSTEVLGTFEALMRDARLAAEAPG